MRLSQAYEDLASRLAYEDDVPRIDSILEELREVKPRPPVEEANERMNIVAFEGINGSCKSSLLDELERSGRQTIRIRYRPDELCPVPELNHPINRRFAAAAVKGQFAIDESMPLLKQTMLIAAYEAYVWETIAERGVGGSTPRNLLVDRMHDSSIVAQSYLLMENGIDREKALQLLHCVYDKIGYPRTTVLLDFPLESCMSRVATRAATGSERQREETLDVKATAYAHQTHQQLTERGLSRYITMHPLRAHWEGRTRYDLKSIASAIASEAFI